MFFDKWQANEECVSVRAVYQCIFELHIIKPDTCVCLLLIGKKINFVEIKVVVLCLRELAMHCE